MKHNQKPGVELNCLLNGFLNLFIFESDRGSVSMGGAEMERARILSRLHAAGEEPDAGLELMKP